MNHQALDEKGLDELDVIIPNLNWRYSGVTATNRTIGPLIATRCHAAWFGLYRPAGVAPLKFRDLIALRLRPPRRHAVRIWHARRNVEMVLGIILKAVGFRLALIFTSAAQRPRTWLTQALIERMDAVIAPSAASAAFLTRKAAIVFHGVDTTVYSPPADRVAEFAATGLPGKYGIGAFGRVRPQKGTDVFVEAMCRLLPKYPEFTAVVIGRTTIEHQLYLKRLQARAAEAGLSERIRFLGELPIEEVPRWFARVSIYAFTSRKEGFGLTLLEAMAAGAALVASRAGAAETVVTDGVTGVLVDPGDADALVEAIEPLMRDPASAAAMGTRGRERVVGNFSSDAEADNIVALYRQVWQAAEMETKAV